MDGIQPYAAGPPRPASLHAVAVPIGAVPKTSNDYLKALRRRVWLVLAIAVPMTVAAAVWTVRLPNVYLAKAQILIEPPLFDPGVSALVTYDVTRREPEAAEKYVPNRIAMLRSKVLADRVVNDPALAQPNASPAGDAADELLTALQTRQAPGTNYFTVTLEGTDAARTAKQLQLLLDTFKDQAETEVIRRIDDSKTYAEQSIKNLTGEIEKQNALVLDTLRNSSTIGPGGKNIKQTEFEMHTAIMLNRHSRLGELQQQAWLAQAFPHVRNSPESSARDIKIAELESLREKFEIDLRRMRRTIRSFDSDPSTKAVAGKLKSVLDRLERLRAAEPAAASGPDPYEALVESTKAEIRKDEETAKTLLAQVQESMPDHQTYLDLFDRRKRAVERLGAIQTKLWEYEMVSKSRRDPITITSPPAEPVVPIRPRRALNIAIAIVLSFGMGIGLVCLLEHVDHRVKLPEQLTAGLGLPLFGVIPRIRRLASIHRGGHLWTPGAPESIEADAYRNLRASLLGVSDRRGPIVKLLVTSAKAGEGKSTTALNLAATCARAGERTLLMDVNLRRPSLAGVFREDDEPPLGLVDVLRGDLPWQRTVIRTDIPNLDFLPTGDTRDVPIEVLGTARLRQLLLGLSNHYDRVILDGPAVLGLADCRMLGRIVDAALLVVRSGTQELRPLQHAKAMLEQSHVVIAGVVFNGLFEDLEDWSSYGPDTPYGYNEPGRSGRTRALPQGPGAPLDESAALPLAGSVST